MSRADIKFIIISTVAVFLLYSVTAQRNGPVKIKNPSNAGVFRVRSSSRSPRGVEGVFRGGLRGRNPSVFPVVYFGTGGGPSTMRLRHARRSLDPRIEPNRITTSVTSHAATFIEPIFLEEPGTHYSEDPLDAQESLGPMIGPLSFPGFGKNLYVRLMMSPDEEDANHVTVHLVNRPSLTSLANIRESKFVERKPWPGKAAAGGAKKLIFHQPVSFTEKPFDQSIDAKPSPNFPEVNWSPIHEIPAPFSGQPEHRAAPNHHQLPIVNRPAENLIDLPIYPPLSSAGPEEAQLGVSRGVIRASGNEAVASNGGQTDANVFARSMHQSTVSSNFGSFPSLLYPGVRPRGGGIESSNVGSGHVLTTGNSVDEMGRNVATGTNADHHLPNEVISGTERPHETSSTDIRVNDPSMDIQSGKHAAGNPDENSS